MSTNWIRKAVVLESGVWRSLFQWMRGKSRTSDNEFAYEKAATPAMWVFVAVSAFEIPLLHFLLPTGWPRVLSLILGAWGLIWMLGFLASMKVLPHTVTEDGIRIRSGLLLDVTIPWDAMESVQLQRRTLAGTKSVQISGEPDRPIAHIVQSSGTNVAIELREPMSIALPKHSDQKFSEIHFYADDPKSVVDYVREFVTREVQ